MRPKMRSVANNDQLCYTLISDIQKEKRDRKKETYEKYKQINKIDYQSMKDF